VFGLNVLKPIFHSPARFGLDFGFCFAIQTLDIPNWGDWYFYHVTVHGSFSKFVLVVVFLGKIWQLY